MKPFVSICCLTYNHQDYIADALDSFLAQECDFQYEIIVHDDASTDSTDEIVRDYERKYPGIIRGIYQNHNQYSKGIRITPTYIVPLVQGEFIATCEGDDFWCDTHKLKKQTEFLEKNKNYSMCFHAVSIIDTAKKPTGMRCGVKGNISRDISISEAARGGVVHVSSRLIRREFFVKKRPDWVSNASYGDYAIALYYRAEGKVFYMDEVMSCYRRGVEGSLMTEFRKHYSIEKDVAHKNNRIKTLEMANTYYEYKFDSEIKKSILQTSVHIYLLQRRLDELARKKYRDYIREYGLVRLGKDIILVMFPRIANSLARLASSFKGLTKL